MLKCWIRLKPVLGGVDGSLHFTVSSMNRLNQTEPATVSILSFWAFFGEFYFLYLVYNNLIWWTDRLRGRGVKVDNFLSSYLSGVGSLAPRKVV
jgi:hypothetical protein